MQMERPKPEGILADEGPLDQRQGWRLVGHARGPARERDVEGVQQADRAEHVPFVGGEVGQGARDREGGEVVVDVGRLRGAAGAAQLQEPYDGQIQVEPQAVRAAGDHAADGFADQGLAVAGEASGEVVVAVLGRGVPFTDRSIHRDVRYLR